MKKILSISSGIFMLLCPLTILVSCAEKEEPVAPEVPEPLSEVSAFTATVSYEFSDLTMQDITYGSFGMLYAESGSNPQEAFDSWAGGNEKPACQIVRKASVRTGGGVSVTAGGLAPETSYTCCLYFKSEDGSNRRITKATTFTTLDFNPEISVADAKNVRFFDAELTGRVIAPAADIDACTVGIAYSLNPDSIFAGRDSKTVKSDADGTIKISAKGLKFGSTYYYRPFVKINHTGEVLYGDTKSFTTRHVDEMAVDLGLSVEWASCDFMAQDPFEYGEVYAWGALKSYHNGTFEKYPYYHEDTGLIDSIGECISGTEYDVVRQTYGGGWRMPTIEEVKELFEKTTVRIAYLNDEEDSYGRYLKFKGKNNTYIDMLCYVRDYYSGEEAMEPARWTGTLKYGNNEYYYSYGAVLFMTSSDTFDTAVWGRYEEHAIRPVREKN